MTNDAGQAGTRDPAFDSIATLVARGLSSPLGTQDTVELDRLIAATPGGAAFADSLVEQWTLAGIAGDPREGLARARDRTAAALDVPAAPPEAVRRRGAWFSAAAAVALAIVAGGGVALHRFATTEAASHLIAATDRPISAPLDDGSHVSLSRDGKVLVRMERRRRVVQQIGGEAYYEVAKDHVRPFTVEASGYRVTALGTRFNVAPEPSGVRIDLLAGRLRIETGRASDRPVFLAAGQRFVGGAHPKIETADPAAADWRSGRLVFNDEPLAQVAQRLSRYSGHRIGIRNTAVGALRFSGVLRWDAPDDWEAAFEATLPVTVERAPDGIEIVGH